MVFFILMILSNVSLCILYKLTERLNCRPEKILLVQFLSATIVSFIYVYVVEGISFNIATLVIGLVGGLATFGAVYAFLALLRLGKFSLSIVIVNLSVSIPIIVSIIVYREKPTFFAYIAFILIIMTFFLMSEKGKNEKIVKNNRKWILLAILSMVLSGIADTGPKIIQEMGLSNISMTYLGYNYFFAIIPTIGVALKKKSFPGKVEWLLGIGMGISILFSMFFLVLTLRSISGTIVYPLNKTLVDVIIIVLSVFIWKERLKIKQIIGVLAAIAAVILLNIGL